MCGCKRSFFGRVEYRHEKMGEVSKTRNIFRVLKQVVGPEGAPTIA